MSDLGLHIWHPSFKNVSYISVASVPLGRLEMFQTGDSSLHSSNLNAFYQRYGRLRTEGHVNLAHNVCSITDICLNDTICSDNIFIETCTGYRAVGGNFNCTIICRGEAHCLLQPADYFILFNQDWVWNLLKCFHWMEFLTDTILIHSLFFSKGKFHPWTGHEGPEGEQMYNSTLPSTSALDGGGQRHAPAALPPREGPGTHCTGGWVGPTAGLDGCGKSRLYRDLIPGPSSP